MAEVLERGNVYFLYRPRVEERDPEGREDVQRLYMMLDPHGEKKMRRIVIGAKRLPDVKNGGGKNWGFVDQVTASKRSVTQGLAAETYETETRGERDLPGARPAAEGVYAIARHGDHTHLAYALELPQEPGPVQEELHIEKEGSFIVSVKNPQAASPKGVGLSPPQQTELPKRLQDRFEGRRFLPVDPVDFLDQEGAEILLIGAREDPSEELDIRLDPQDEDLEHSELITKLRLPEKEHPREPLSKGEWR